MAEEAAYAGVNYEYAEQIDKDHGRLEIRRYWVTEELGSLPRTELWKGLRSIGMVERECLQGDTRTLERRYFINSIPADAKRFAQAVRGHWGIENRLHWHLEVIVEKKVNPVAYRVCLRGTIEQSSAQLIQSQTEHAAGAALMFLDGNGLWLIQPDTDLLIAPTQRQGHHPDQASDPLGIGDMGVFEVEAPALHRRKQAGRWDPDP